MNGEMISLAPKSYVIHCKTQMDTKDGRKGIPAYVELTTKEFFDTLYEDNVKNKVDVRSLRLDKNKKMTRTSTIKSGLTPVHVKLQVGEDKVSCRPLQRPDGTFI